MRLVWRVDKVRVTVPSICVGRTFMCLWDSPLLSQSLPTIRLCLKQRGMCRVKGTCSQILSLPRLPCLDFPLTGSSAPSAPQTPHSGELNPQRNLQTNPGHMNSCEQGSLQSQCLLPASPPSPVLPHSEVHGKVGFFGREGGK